MIVELFSGWMFGSSLRSLHFAQKLIEDKKNVNWSLTSFSSAHFRSNNSNWRSGSNLRKRFFKIQALCRPESNSKCGNCNGTISDVKEQSTNNEWVLKRVFVLAQNFWVYHSKGNNWKSIIFRDKYQSSMDFYQFQRLKEDEISSIAISAIFNWLKRQKTWKFTQKLQLLKSTENSWNFFWKPDKEKKSLSWTRFYLQDNIIPGFIDQ